MIIPRKWVNLTLAYRIKLTYEVSLDQTVLKTYYTPSLT